MLAVVGHVLRPHRGRLVGDPKLGGRAYFLEQFVPGRPVVESQGEFYSFGGLEYAPLDVNPSCVRQQGGQFPQHFQGLGGVPLPLGHALQRGLDGLAFLVLYLQFSQHDFAVANLPFGVAEVGGGHADQQQEARDGNAGDDMPRADLRPASGDQRRAGEVDGLLATQCAGRESQDADIRGGALGLVDDAAGGFDHVPRIQRQDLQFEHTRQRFGQVGMVGQLAGDNHSGRQGGFRFGGEGVQRRSHLGGKRRHGLLEKAGAVLVEEAGQAAVFIDGGLSGEVSTRQVAAEHDAVVLDEADLAPVVIDLGEKDRLAGHRAGFHEREDHPGP